VPWLEAWTVLAAVARETTRTRLATYVSQIPLATHGVRHLGARKEAIGCGAPGSRYPQTGLGDVTSPEER